MTVTAVIARWNTDQGVCETRDWGPHDRPVPESLTRMAKYVEDHGMFVVKLLRVFTQEVPLIGGQPAFAMAKDPIRQPESMFHMKHSELEATDG
jgi:hypothetical protein